MALSSLLLLCIIAYKVWHMESKPIDFVCDRDSRRDMNTEAEMKGALEDCDFLTILPSAIQLPCSKLHKASWDRKSAQEKRADLSASLAALLGSVRVARTLSPSGCVLTQLERLEHMVNNYLHIVTHLDIKGPVGSPVLSCTPQSTHSLSTVLQTLSRLLTGKLELLMADLTHVCP
ncbi:hypothetical protein UPYG_G00288630 [Umbra pygmaea]|uniref:Thrombopoietin n=1 Tax=Umbra pygmaea TaxID=75934 RepID=A0ABD0W4Y2_UMBPY